MSAEIRVFQMAECLEIIRKYSSTSYISLEGSHLVIEIEESVMDSQDLAFLEEKGWKIKPNSHFSFCFDDH